MDNSADDFKVIKQFDLYISSVYPGGISANQYRHLKDCFFAAYFASLSRLLELVVKDPLSAHRFIDEARDECLVHCEAVTGRPLRAMAHAMQSQGDEVN